MSNEKQDVLLAWQLADNFGWGVAGLNIFMNWCFNNGPRPTMLHNIESSHVSGVHPLRIASLAPEFGRSNSTSQMILEKMKQGAVSVSCPIVHALGNNFASGSPNLIGTKNIGRMVFEFPLPKEARKETEKFDVLVVASKWNQMVLQSITDVPVILNHEGVDDTMFFPAPSRGLAPSNCFYVFSGGKPELRKGQDLVLAAFKQFAKNKLDVRLVTAWQSPWPGLSEGLRGCLQQPLRVRNGIIDVHDWAEANGLAAGKVIDVGKIPNSQAATLLREVDCSIQLSRCEGGTNFVAMESLACGIPTLMSACSGHMDIIQTPGVIPITSPNRPDLSYHLDEHWGEPDIDEATNSLEAIYAEWKRTGEKARSSGRFERTWHHHSLELETIISEAGN